MVRKVNKTYWILFPKMTLTQSPIFLSSKNPDHLLMNKVWIFLKTTLAQFLKSDFLNFDWIFFPKMTLPDVPDFWIFFQDSQIRVEFLEFLEKKSNQNSKNWILGTELAFLEKNPDVIHE